MFITKSYVKMSIPTKKYTNVSRIISHALRHEPWIYELELDENGWVPIDEFMSSLKSLNKEYENITVFDIEQIIKDSTKKRHEIQGDKIRALYGHSIPGKLLKTPSIPPEYLYHGTSPQFIERIRQFGLLPMKRQYVHLSTNKEIALDVGKRKSDKPIILKIEALKAHQNNIKFYIGNNFVWLADKVPAEYIKLNVSDLNLKMNSTVKIK